MSVQRKYVAVDGTYSCHTADGSLVEIGSKPVAVPAELVPALDASPFVVPAGAAPPDKDEED